MCSLLEAKEKKKLKDKILFSSEEYMYTYLYAIFKK